MASYTAYPYPFCDEIFKVTYYIHTNDSNGRWEDLKVMVGYTNAPSEAAKYASASTWYRPASSSNRGGDSFQQWTVEPFDAHQLWEIIDAEHPRSNLTPAQKILEKDSGWSTRGTTAGGELYSQRDHCFLRKGND